jgi:hypothetical protein
VQHGRSKAYNSSGPIEADSPNSLLRCSSWAIGEEPRRREEGGRLAAPAEGTGGVGRPAVDLRGGGGLLLVGRRPAADRRRGGTRAAPRPVVRLQIDGARWPTLAVCADVEREGGIGAAEPVLRGGGGGVRMLEVAARERPAGRRLQDTKDGEGHLR